MNQDQGQEVRSEAGDRIKNWPTDNAGLIARGPVTMWRDVERLKASERDVSESQRGRPRLYADGVIQMWRTLKQVYRLSWRALQGFAQSVGWPGLRVPNYTTLSRRAQQWEVERPVIRLGEPLHRVGDSTGLKVWGEGEGKVRPHGYSKRRTGRKVHGAGNLSTGQVRAALMTHRDVDDASVLPERLNPIPADDPLAVVRGDGAGGPCSDGRAGGRSFDCASPRRNAWAAQWARAAGRNRVINIMAPSSPSAWKKHSGSHRRSLVENLMGRLKTLTGEKCGAQRLGAQATELAMRVGILNRMAALARPLSVPFACAAGDQGTTRFQL